MLLSVRESVMSLARISVVAGVAVESSVESEEWSIPVDIPCDMMMSSNLALGCGMQICERQRRQHQQPYSTTLYSSAVLCSPAKHQTTP